MTGAETVLRLAGVTKIYNGRGPSITAVEDVSLDVRAGESVVIQGPSGSGKSTLLLIAAAMLKPTRGGVSLCGASVTDMSMQLTSRLRQASVGIILPTLELVPYLSAIENAYLMDASSAGKVRAKNLLETLGLSERVEHFPRQLSTGEQRRVLVARALLNRPKILLCDEPTANVDAENADLIRTAISDARKQGIAVVTVTHEDASKFKADSIYTMKRGTLEKVNAVV